MNADETQQREKRCDKTMREMKSNADAPCCLRCAPTTMDKEMEMKRERLPSRKLLELAAYSVGESCCDTLIDDIDTVRQDRKAVV